MGVYDAGVRISPRQKTKEVLRKKYPQLDLCEFDKFYEVITSEMHKKYKKDCKLCYNNKCDRRMY